MHINVQVSTQDFNIFFCSSPKKSADTMDASGTCGCVFAKPARAFCSHSRLERSGMAVLTILETVIFFLAFVFLVFARCKTVVAVGPLASLSAKLSSLFSLA